MSQKIGKILSQFDTTKHFLSPNLFCCQFTFKALPGFRGAT